MSFLVIFIFIFGESTYNFAEIETIFNFTHIRKVLCQFQTLRMLSIPQFLINLLGTFVIILVFQCFWQQGKIMVQSTLTCSKITVETLEKGVEYVQS